MNVMCVMYIFRKYIMFVTQHEEVLFVTLCLQILRFVVMLRQSVHIKFVMFNNHVSVVRIIVVTVVRIIVVHC